MNFRFANGVLLFFCGCAAVFGWDVHAPGVLSEDFGRSVHFLDKRVGLYFDPQLLNYESRNRGSRTADPQTYHIGEAFGPMLVEAFQAAFREFVFLEVEPDPDILNQYGIPYLAVVRIKDFYNRVTWKGQAVSLVAEVVVMDQRFRLLGRFEVVGSSDAQKAFAKKGGPEVNLNAALENNVLAIIQYLQDSIQTGTWP